MRQSESEVAGTNVPRALFLVLFGLALAVIWVVLGTSHSASAEEAPPPTPPAPAAAPSLLGSLASTVDGVVATVAPQQPAIVAPVVQTISHTVTALVQPSAQPVIAAVAPITQTVDAVVTAVPGVAQVTGAAPVSTVTNPLTTTLDAVAGPIVRPVLADVVGPVITDVVGPVVGPVLGPVLGPVIGPVLIPELDGTGAAVSDPLDLGNLDVATGAAVSAAPGASPTRSDIRLTRALAGHSPGTVGSSAVVPRAPATPFSPFDDSPGGHALGMLSGSSSTAGAASGAAAAGVLGGFGLPARLVLGSAAFAADDALPSSLTLDPGSSPD